MIRKQMIKKTVAKRTPLVLKETPIIAPSAGCLTGWNRRDDRPALYLPTGRPFRPGRDSRSVFELCTVFGRGESSDGRKGSTCCEGSIPSDRAPSFQAPSHG